MRAKDVLSDDDDEGDFSGVKVRKGTVGAFLANAKILEDPAASAESRAAAEQDIIEALPALDALGLFDVLLIRDEKLRALVETNRDLPNAE